jgi:hypothetical protein
MTRAIWIGLGVVCGVALLLTAGIIWHHLHHWDRRHTLVHVGLVLFFGVIGWQCFRRARART